MGSAGINIYLILAGKKKIEGFGELSSAYYGIEDDEVIEDKVEPKKKVKDIKIQPQLKIEKMYNNIKPENFLNIYA